MADETVRVKVKIETSGQEGLKQTEDQLNKLASALEKRQRAAEKNEAKAAAIEARATARAAKELAREQRTSAAVSSQLDRRLARETNARERAATQAERAAMREAAAREKAATRERRAMVSVENEMERLERLDARRAARATARERLNQRQPGSGIAGFLQGHGMTSTLRQSLGAMRDLTVAGMGAYYTARAIGGMASSFIDPMMDFQTATTQMRIKGGFSAADTANLSASFISNAKNSTFSPIEQAHAATELAAAGVKAGEMRTAMGSTLRFGQANGTDSGRSAAMLVETGAQFGLGTSQFERIGNTITKAANLSTISVEDMSEALKYVGPIAKTAGLDIESTAGSIALLGESGLKGSMGGTAIRTIIASLVKPAKQAKLAMAEIGLSKKEMQAGLTDLPKFFELLDKKMGAKHLSNPQRLEVEKSLFGVEGLQAAEAFMAALNKKTEDGTDAWRAYIDNVRAATGAMEEASAMIDQTTEGKMKRLSATWEASKLQMAASFQPFLDRMIPKIADVITSVGNSLGGAETSSAGGVLSKISDTYGSREDSGYRQMNSTLEVGEGGILQKLGALMFDLDSFSVGGKDGYAGIGRTRTRGLSRGLPGLAMPDTEGSDAWKLPGETGIPEWLQNPTATGVPSPMRVPVAKQRAVPVIGKVDITVHAGSGTTATVNSVQSAPSMPLGVNSQAM